VITDTLYLSSAARIGRRWFRRDRSMVVAAVVLAAIAIPCLLAPVIAPYDPRYMPDIVNLKFAAPSHYHLMGTDASSRDILTRLLYGGRVSLTLAVFATLVSITVGTAYGAIAGYSSGWTADILERVLDTLLAIPRLLVLIVIFATWDNIEMKGFILIIGVTGWYGLARLVRGQVLALKSQDFVASARALGATQTRIVVRHILPNVVTPVAVAATLGLGHIIILEAGLSWLGIGLKVPNPSWGNMIQEGSDLMISHWWISLFPGLALVLTVLCFNILGDGLLRALNPRPSK
jgi:peptide/nickel transport system permease protein